MLREKIIFKDNIKKILIRTYNNLRPGNLVIYNNKKYIVTESNISFKQNILINDIILNDLNDFKINYKHSKNIRGSSILAKVIKIINKNNIAMMQVDFSYGLYKLNKGYQRENKTYIDIPYKTFYSKTNTGLFPCPEKDDIVEVTFLDDDERNLKVSWAINNELSSRFNDSNYRNYKTKDFELILKEDKYSLSVMKNFVVNTKKYNINCENIFVNAKKDISFATDGYIAIESQKETSIYSNELTLNSKKGTLKLFSDRKIQMKALKIQSD